MSECKRIDLEDAFLRFIEVNRIIGNDLNEIMGLRKGENLELNSKSPDRVFLLFDIYLLIIYKCREENGMETFYSKESDYDGLSVLDYIIKNPEENL